MQIPKIDETAYMQTPTIDKTVCMQIHSRRCGNSIRHIWYSEWKIMMIGRVQMIWQQQYDSATVELLLIYLYVLE